MQTSYSCITCQSRTVELVTLDRQNLSQELVTLSNFCVLHLLFTLTSNVKLSTSHYTILDSLTPVKNSNNCALKFKTISLKSLGTSICCRKLQRDIFLQIELKLIRLVCLVLLICFTSKLHARNRRRKRNEIGSTCPDENWKAAEQAVRSIDSVTKSVQPSLELILKLYYKMIKLKMTKTVNGLFNRL